MKRLSDVNQNNTRLQNVAAPVNDADAATKKYVDDNVIGTTTEWGGISGDIQDQTDLQSALAGKSDIGHTHTLDGVGGITVSSIAPVGPEHNDIWIKVPEEN